MLLTTPRWGRCFSFCPVVYDPRSAQGGDVLLCIFGPIVPVAVLERFQRAYNVHPGPPEFPGRDPHHWAIYEGAETFGVTLHEMVARVDEGPILAVERFSISEAAPLALRDEANRRAVAMMLNWGPRLLNRETPSAVRESWRGRKRTRADLIAMCNLKDVPPDERKRRERAFAGFVSPAELHSQ